MSITPAKNSRGRAFPSSGVDNSARGKHRPEPNMLGRNDLEHERWIVEDCRAIRNEPRTDLSNRIMFAPSQDGELERVIRGHEMMHARVSPSPEQMEAWIGRSLA
jgi:hypothetical protein